MSGFLRRHQKKIIWGVVIAFFVGGVGLVSLNQSGIFRSTNAGEEGPAYAARVNNKDISSETAQMAFENLFNQYMAYYQQVGQDTNELLKGAAGALFLLDLQKQAIQSLIRQELYDQAAAERRIRTNRGEVEAAFATEYNGLLERNGITESDLVNYLSAQGRTLAEFQASLRAQIETQLKNEALREAVVGVVTPTEDELLSYLETNITRYDVPEQVRASHILVSDESTAWELYDRLMEGAEFAELAREHSEDSGTAEEGGDLDWFERGSMVQEFEDAAFSLKVGEFSKPVKTQFGYHLILLTDRQEAHTPTLDEVRDQVRKDYIQSEKSKRFSDWYDDFYTASDIEIALPRVKARLLEEQDPERGIAEYERLQESGEVSDPYLPYYIGRAYETLVLQLSEERTELEELEEPTEEDLTRIDELKARAEEYEAKALAQYLRALEEVDADENLINRVLQLDPDSATARYLLGKLLEERGDIVGADTQYHEVMTTSPDFVPAYLASGDLAMRLGNSEMAVRRYEEALELREDDASILVKLANAYLSTGSLDEAAETIEKIRQVDPGNVRMIIAEGDLAHERLSRAIEERDALKEKEDQTAEDETRIAELEGQIEELEQIAIERFEKALQSGGSLDLNVKLGQVYLLVGRLKEAEDEFYRVKLQSPYRVEAYLGLAEVQIEQGEIEDAVANLRSAFQRSFDDLEKERIAKRILEFSPDDTETRRRLAQTLAAQYKWTAATREYAAVLESDPASIEAYLGIAEAYRWRGDAATAVDYLQRGLTRATYDSQRIELYLALIEAVRAQVGAGQPLTSTGLDARLELAKLYLIQGKDTAALTQLELIQGDDRDYRGAEVRELILRAGGEVEPLPVGEVQTEGQTVDPMDEPADGA